MTSAADMESFRRFMSERRQEQVDKLDAETIRPGGHAFYKDDDPFRDTQGRCRHLWDEGFQNQKATIEIPGYGEPSKAVKNLLKPKQRSPKKKSPKKSPKKKTMRAFRNDEWNLGLRDDGSRHVEVNAKRHVARP